MPLPRKSIPDIAKRISEQSIKNLFLSYTSQADAFVIDGVREVHVGEEGLFYLASDNGKCAFMGGMSAPCDYHLKAGKLYQICVADNQAQIDALQPDFSYSAIAHKINIEGKEWLGCWTDGVSFTDRIGLMHEGKTYYVGITAK